MEDVRLRLKCLQLAMGMTYDPASALRLSLAFEGYAICGFNVGMGMLANPPTEPIPAAPLSAAQRAELDRALAEILIDDATPHLH